MKSYTKFSSELDSHFKVGKIYKLNLPNRKILTTLNSKFFEKKYVTLLCVSPINDLLRNQSTDLISISLFCCEQQEMLKVTFFPYNFSAIDLPKSFVRLDTEKTNLLDSIKKMILPDHDEIMEELFNLYT